MSAPHAEWIARAVAVVSLVALAFILVHQTRSTFNAELTVSDTTIGRYLFEEEAGPALGSTRRVRQTITPNLNGLIRLDIGFAQAGDPGYPVRLRILDESGTLLRQSSVPSGEILGGNLHIFGFDRIPDSAGRRYEIVLDAPRAPMGRGPTVSWAERDILPGGRLLELGGEQLDGPSDLFVNERALPEDPATRLHLLEKRIDAFRPGWAGWQALVAGVVIVAALGAVAWLLLIGTAWRIRSPVERIAVAVTTCGVLGSLAAWLS